MLDYFFVLVCVLWSIGSPVNALALPGTQPPLSSSPGAEQKNLFSTMVLHGPDLEGGINLDDQTAVKNALDATQKELGELSDTDPYKEVKQKMLNLQMDILQKQLGLLQDLEHQGELQTLVSSSKLEQARAARDQAVSALQNLNLTQETSSLTSIPKIEDLQQRVGRDFDQPLQQAKSAFDQTTQQLQQLTTELAGLPQLIEEAQKGRIEMQSRLSELQQTLQQNSNLSLPERQLLTRRIAIRSQGLYYYQKPLDYLEHHRTILEQLVTLYKLLQEKDEAYYKRAKTLDDAAQAYLQKRLAEESQAAQTQLRRKQEELQSTQKEYQKLYKTEDVTIQQLEAAHKAHLQRATTLVEKLNQIKDALEKASIQFKTYQQLYGGERGGSPLPSSEDVARTLAQLLEKNDRTVFLRERSALLEEQRDLDTQLATVQNQLATLDTDFATKIEQAQTLFKQYLAQHQESDPGGERWKTEFLKWNDLKNRKTDLLKQEQETLAQITPLSLPVPMSILFP